ncbi:hypothetical protein GQ457_15G025310 [Hibiscus cannabinus]
MSRHPEVKWAERADKVCITVLLLDSKNAKVNLDPEGVFTFSANAGADNNLYELKLDLYDKVNVEESTISIGVRNIVCVLEKVEKVWWKKLLRGDGKTPHYIKVDWDKWVDEDEDTGPGDIDLGGMDFSSFGNMGGMDGGMDDSEDSSDDEEQEVMKPAEADTNKVNGNAKPEEQGAGASEKKEANAST